MFIPLQWMLLLKGAGRDSPPRLPSLAFIYSAEEPRPGRSLGMKPILSPLRTHQSTVLPHSAFQESILNPF